MNVKIVSMFFLLILSVNSLFANDGSYAGFPQSGTVFPIQNNAIKMVSEEVIYKDGVFTTNFVFFNTTKEQQEITIGFPVIGDFSADGDVTSEEYNLAQPKDEEAKKEDIRNYYKFRSIIDGKEIERTLTGLSKDYANEGYDYVFVTKVKFLPQQEITITNTYNQSINNGGSTDGTSSNSIDYILKTGVLWTGNIERASIVFYLKDADGYDNSYLFSNNSYNRIFKAYITLSPMSSRIYSENDYLVVKWDFKNFKPTENIAVSWGMEHAQIGSADLMNSTESGDEELNKRKEKFFDEMQNERIFRSYIIALAKGNLFVPSKEEIEAFGDNRESLGEPRILINSLYALKGYKFTKPELLTFYKKFSWYKPIIKNPEFSQEEKDLITQLNKLAPK